tara:strand:- start:568 stop:864 length:297 start_codon:yes stop_codon:yes gene_type:complete
MITIFEKTLEALDAGGWTANGNKYEDIVWKNDGKKKPTKKEFEDKKKELENEYEKQAYSRNRKAEYPNLEECIHAILDDDLPALQAKRKLIKDKFPKP